eukprot:COSAG06_NODE_2306_length_7110_cov_99.335188_3_plen_94_part_00
MRRAAGHAGQVGARGVRPGGAVALEQRLGRVAARHPAALVLPELLERCRAHVVAEDGARAGAHALRARAREPRDAHDLLARRGPGEGRRGRGR